MKQQLFTLEGKEYRVKTATNSFLKTYVGSSNISKYVFINNPTGSSSIDEAVKFTTSKNIIPVSYSASALNGSGAVIADISNCYYAIQSGGLNFLPTYRNSLAKSYPYVQRIFYTDANIHNFMCQYNQMIFSNNDFTSISDPLAISFFSSLGQSMTQSDISFSPEKFVLPAGTYILTFTFTYLELQ